jgi:trans-L-3-hydroxyproline dehydratase
VDADALGLTLTPSSVRQLIDAGMAIKRAVIGKGPIDHPYERDLGFLYGTILVGPAEHPRHHSRNVCVFADGEVDRSPTGTGVSGRAAIHYARGELAPGEVLRIESIIGTTFEVAVLEDIDYGPHAAVVPEVSGSAAITGRHEFLLDPADPQGAGFLVK